MSQLRVTVPQQDASHSQEGAESDTQWWSLSRVQRFATPWTVAHQAPPSMGFSRLEYWSGLPFPAPGDLPHLGIKPESPALQADPLLSEPPGKPRKWRTQKKE